MGRVGSSDVLPKEAGFPWWPKGTSPRVSSRVKSFNALWYAQLFESEAHRCLLVPKLVPVTQISLCLGNADSLFVVPVIETPLF
jgi:hypothetical protein